MKNGARGTRITGKEGAGGGVKEPRGKVNQATGRGNITERKLQGRQGVTVGPA